MLPIVLFFECLCWVLTIFIIFSTFYTIATTPLFHQYLICIIGNMALAFTGIALARLIQLFFVSKFDPKIGKFKWENIFIQDFR